MAQRVLRHGHTDGADWRRLAEDGGLGMALDLLLSLPQGVVFRVKNVSLRTELWMQGV